MDFAAAAAKLAGTVKAVFGEPADLAGPGGDPAPARVSAIFDEAEDLAKIVDGFAGGVTVALIPKADVPGVVPGARWTLTRYPDTAPEVWILSEPSSEEAGFWRAPLSRDARPVPR